jgi:hypothetical protein
MNPLAIAITAVESAGSALSTADSTKATAQQRFDAAQAAKTQADSDDLKAQNDFNASLDALIQAATDAKIPAAPVNQTAPNAQ